MSVQEAIKWPATAKAYMYNLEKCEVKVFVSREQLKTTDFHIML